MVGAHRSGDVLDLLFTEILVGQVQFGLDLIESLLRDTDAAGFGQALQARRDVNTIAMDVVALAENGNFLGRAFFRCSDDSAFTL